VVIARRVDRRELDIPVVAAQTGWLFHEVLCPCGAGLGWHARALHMVGLYTLNSKILYVQPLTTPICGDAALRICLCENRRVSPSNELHELLMRRDLCNFSTAN
jgi:hypothetical protein